MAVSAWPRSTPKILARPEILVVMGRSCARRRNLPIRRSARRSRRVARTERDEPLEDHGRAPLVGAGLEGGGQLRHGRLAGGLERLAGLRLEVFRKDGEHELRADRDEHPLDGAHRGGNRLDGIGVGGHRQFLDAAPRAGHPLLRRGATDAGPQLDDRTVPDDERRGGPGSHLRIGRRQRHLGGRGARHQEQRQGQQPSEAPQNVHPVVAEKTNPSGPPAKFSVMIPALSARNINPPPPVSTMPSVVSDELPLGEHPADVQEGDQASRAEVPDVQDRLPDLEGSRELVGVDEPPAGQPAVRLLSAVLPARLFPELQLIVGAEGRAAGGGHGGEAAGHHRAVERADESAEVAVVPAVGVPHQRPRLQQGARGGIVLAIPGVEHQPQAAGVVGFVQFASHLGAEQGRGGEGGELGADDAGRHGGLEVTDDAPGHLHPPPQPPAPHPVVVAVAVLDRRVVRGIVADAEVPEPRVLDPVPLGEEPPVLPEPGRAEHDGGHLAAVEAEAPPWRRASRRRATGRPTRRRGGNRTARRAGERCSARRRCRGSSCSASGPARRAGRPRSRAGGPAATSGGAPSSSS